jgi:hypothetical protein
MQPGQMAIVWMMYDQIQRSEAASRRSHSLFRRFAYRAQLGPVGGPAAA